MNLEFVDKTKTTGMSVLKDIERDLVNRLDRCGLMYRIFSRSKTVDSLSKKIAKNPQKYSEDGKKIQDVLGLRIVFYFASDVRLFSDLLKTEPNYNDISDNENEFKEKIQRCRDCEHYSDVKFEELFRPVRLNMVFKIPSDLVDEFRNEISILGEEKSKLIDNTYEVQLRSVLSEGWHEVEHDLRYKCQSDWVGFEEQSRTLNGIYAALESHESAMEMLFEKKAYAHYKKMEWESLLKDHLRLRISGNPIRAEIKAILDADSNNAKSLIRCSRKNVIRCLYAYRKSFIISLDNLVFLINRISEPSIDQIKELESELMSSKLDEIVQNIQNANI